MGASTGQAVADILFGAWRPVPPPVDFSIEKLEAVELHLMTSGAAGLTWNRIKHDDRVASSDVGRRFKDAHRLHVLHASIHREQIQKVLGVLNAEGIDPLLFKGWDCARLYPDQGMRPFGDIDLMLLPGDLDRAQEALRGAGVERGVDVEHPMELRGSSLEELFSRARRAVGDGIECLVLSEEDRLRVLSIHFLKSGGWRPLNLCDIAAAIERGQAADEQACLTDDRIASSWTTSTLALAGALLGADLGTCAISRGSGPPPSWLPRAVLRAWGHPFPAEWGTHPPRMPSLRHPVEVARELRSRWPDPVTSTVWAGTAANRVPRLVSQVAYVAKRTVNYLRSQRGR